MARHDDRELNQLLARGRLSGAEYDQVEERVLARVAPRPRRWPWPLLLPVATLASAAGIFLLLRAPSDGAPGFTSKGDASQREAMVTVGCGGEKPLFCHLGDTLMFSVGARPREGYLVAYAERLGDPSAERIWYFPHAGSTSPRVPARATTSVLPEGVRLGAPHTRGRYRITLRISDVPISRSQIEGLVKDGEQVITLDID